MDCQRFSAPRSTSRPRHRSFQAAWFSPRRASKPRVAARKVKRAAIRSGSLCRRLESRLESWRITYTRPGWAERVRRLQWSTSVDVLDSTLDALRAFEPGDVGRAAGRQTAARFPLHQPVDDWYVGAGGLRAPGDPATGDACGIQAPGDYQVAVRIDLDPHLVPDHGGKAAAAEDQDLDLGGCGLRLKPEPCVQLSTAEVVGLLDQGRLLPV